MSGLESDRGRRLRRLMGPASPRPLFPDPLLYSYTQVPDPKRILTSTEYFRSVVDSFLRPLHFTPGVPVLRPSASRLNWGFGSVKKKVPTTGVFLPLSTLT